MAEIEIPQDLLDEFRNSKRNAQTGSDGESVEPGGLDKLSFEMAKRIGTQILKTFDDSMTSKGAPGLGKVKPEGLAELGVVAFEDDLTAKMVKDAPKAMFLLTCGAIVSQNAVYIVRQRKKNSGNAEEQPDEDGSKAGSMKSASGSSNKAAN